MKIQLLPSTFDAQGRARPEQRLTCYVVDDRVALDAGSVALALSDAQRETVRDVVVTHPHADHVATLPIFVDDLFSRLTAPVRVHATAEVVRLLRRDLFNGTIYPRFDELRNGHGRVLEFAPFEPGAPFGVAHLTVTAVPVNHIVPTVGLVVTDGETTVAFSSDTAATDDFWRALDALPRLDALLVEASFPNAMGDLARVSGHLTPDMLRREIDKMPADVPIWVFHIKPQLFEETAEELANIDPTRIHTLEQGKTYTI